MRARAASCCSISIAQQKLAQAHTSPRASLCVRVVGLEAPAFPRNLLAALAQARLRTSRGDQRLRLPRHGACHAVPANQAAPKRASLTKPAPQRPARRKRARGRQPAPRRHTMALGRDPALGGCGLEEDDLLLLLILLHALSLVLRPTVHVPSSSQLHKVVEVRVRGLLVLLGPHPLPPDGAHGRDPVAAEREGRAPVDPHREHL
mmetsp:Transcript_37604/g.92443  ORF Transcript_37604/g.92443 Transcript_37604/m.92443 type:complete len:205 (-) Transcript_37604:107-721(-)